MENENEKGKYWEIEYTVYSKAEFMEHNAYKF